MNSYEYTYSWTRHLLFKVFEASDELVRTRYACYLNALGKMADAQLELAGKSQIIFTAYKVNFCFTWAHCLRGWVL